MPDVLYSLVPPGNAALSLVVDFLDTPKPLASHGTLGKSSPLLDILENKLASRSLHLPDLVGTGVIGQATPVGHSLNHYV